MRASSFPHFSIDTDSHQVVFSYRPEHIHISALEKQQQTTTEGCFLEQTLPQEVKEECEKLQDLFEFLSTQKPTGIEVSDNEFRFKVVRIKKERWYNLALSRTHSDSPYSRQSTRPLPHRPGLLAENTALKAQLKALRRAHRKLAAEHRQAQIGDLRRPGLEAEYCRGQLSTAGRSYSGCKYKHLALQVNPNCRGSASYRLKHNVVQKVTKELLPLVFRHAIGGEKVSLAIRVQSSLAQNWVVFGLMGVQHFNSPFCYFASNTVAFQGNLGVVFVQVEMLKCQGSLNTGDTLELSVGAQEMVWSINKKAVCAHLRPECAIKRELYPFLMLAQPGDIVTLVTQ